MTKSQRKRLGICPKCFDLKPLTKHHIYVQRFYGKNPSVILLCRGCHNEIEAILRSAEMDRGGKLRHWEYLQIVKVFIKEVFYDQETGLASP